MRGQGYRHDNPKILCVLLVTATAWPGGHELGIDSFIIGVMIVCLLDSGYKYPSHGCQLH